MSKKFRNIENDEAFKNFKLEDYMPAMPEHKQEKSSSIAAEEEPIAEAGSLFPVLDEPDTSAIQVAVSDTRIHEQVTGAESDDKIVESREIGRVRENITKALKLIATRCNLSVVPSLKMTKDIYQRAIDNVSVSKII